MSSCSMILQLNIVFIQKIAEFICRKLSVVIINAILALIGRALYYIIQKSRHSPVQFCRVSMIFTVC